jgi:hypothetical protein
LEVEEMKLDSGFRRNDDENTVMAGRRPGHLLLANEMRGSSPRMTKMEVGEGKSFLWTTFLA